MIDDGGLFGAMLHAQPSGVGMLRHRLSFRKKGTYSSGQRKSSSGTRMPPSLSPEEAELLRRTPQQYSLEQALETQLVTS